MDGAFQKISSTICGIVKRMCGFGGIVWIDFRRFEAGRMGWKVLEIAVTPNPNAKKFVLDQPVSPQPLSFFTADAAKDHPLAAELFRVPGVTNLLLLGDFITVSKRSEVQWQAIVPRVREILKKS
jgi:scaffold Nfu/NifU family protein